MKKRILCGVMALCLASVFLCSCKPKKTDPEDIVIHSIDSLNAGEPVINDHAEDWDKSRLEPNFRQYTEVTEGKLRIKAANYPRIKKIADDRYILFYQDNQTASNIYYSISSDLKEWGLGLKLFNAHNITVFDSSDKMCYSSCDATVLQNGDIMAIASFRSGRNFRVTNEFNGLAMKISSDGGQTWGEEQIIYKGSNWSRRSCSSRTARSRSTSPTAVPRSSPRWRRASPPPRWCRPLVRRSSGRRTTEKPGILT